MSIFDDFLFAQTTGTNDLLQTSNNIGFIENKGQILDQNLNANPTVRFLLPLANGMNVQVKENSISYDTYTIDQSTKKSIDLKGINKASITKPSSYKFHRVDISFPGCNPRPQLIAEKKSEDYRVYSDQQNGNSIIVYHYEKILYKDLYRNIDLILEKSRDNTKGFEYYFIVRPGGDPGQICIQYKGATTHLQNNYISLYVRQGEIREKIPSSFLVDGSSQDFLKAPVVRKVRVAYKTTDPDTYSFSCSAYDRTKTLIIDPVPDLVWGTYWGSNNNEWGNAIARDSNGDLIVGGKTGSSSNIATAGAYQTIYGGNEDALLGKFQANGTLLWVTYLGGTDTDAILSLATDDANNIYIAGLSNSPNAISTPGTHQPVKAFGADGMILKFSSSGNRIWGTYFGGEQGEFLHSIKVAQDGYIYIAGWTESTTGIATAGSYQPAYAGGILNDAGDGILAKFNQTGNRIWATYYGGISFDRFYDMEIDNAGFLYAAGIAYSTAGISSPGSFQPAKAGGISDAFLVKFDFSGNRQWATYYGGNLEEYVAGLNFGSNGYITICGVTLSTTGFGTSGTQQPAFGGGQRDAFVAQFDATGARRWGTYLGGNLDEVAEAVVSDMNDNIYVTGGSQSSTNISTPNSYQVNTLTSTFTTFLLKYNSSGVRQWGTYYGHSGPFGSGEGYDVVVDNSGNAYITGGTSYTNNIATCGAPQPNWSNNLDLFLARFSETQSSTPSVTITASPAGPYCAGTFITFTALPLDAGNNLSYQWKVNGVNTGSNSSTFTSNSLLNGDVIICIVTTTPSPCNPSGSPITSNNIVIVITSPVTPSISISGSATTICQGNSVTFTSSVTNAGNNPSYQWKVNNINVGTNASSFTSASLNNGDIVSCILTSSLTCTTTTNAISNSIPITVTAIIPPTITLIPDNNNVCAGTAIRINTSVQNVSGPVTYQWKVNGNATGTNTTFYSSNSLNNGDKVHCILTATFANCPAISVSSDTITMLIKDVPIITLLPGNVTIFWQDSVQLLAASSGTIGSFAWSPLTYLNNPASLSPFAKPDETITYSITIDDINGCTASKDITVTVLHNIYIPSAFTPNNDGKNDVFRIPSGISIILDQFSVFDRSGNRIFSTRNSAEGWDGTYLGIPSPVGIYVYLIKGKSTKGEIQLKGTVALIR
jgi:gliding motility-associated-like protein